MSALIEAQGLGRNFADIQAVRGVSFSVEAGDVLGFLGPNGAGKSTTMKMLSGFLEPSYGTARVAGFDICEQSREVRKRLGYLPENAPLYGEMRVLEFLRFVAEVRGIAHGQRASAIDRVIERTSLESVLSQRIETLSKGFRRRVGLAQALIHDPDILILDEPTDGLDPNQKHDVRALIQSMTDKCIILSTHILEEVDAVCNRAIIIAHGEIVADDTPNGLRLLVELEERQYRLRLSRQAADTAEQFLRQQPSIASVDRAERGAESLFVIDTIPEQGFSPELLLREALDQQWGLVEFVSQSTGLDAVFREITSRQLHD